jgi:thiamine biosynthesis lipoprotein
MAALLALYACGGAADLPAQHSEPGEDAPRPAAAESEAAPATRAAASPTSPATAAGPTAAPSELPLYKRTREQMGTVISITVVGAETPVMRQAVEDAFDEIDRLEQLLSEWRPDSEISRINAAAGEQAIEVSPDTLAVIEAGIAISRWSDGAYDLTWAALRGMYKFQPGDETVPDPTEVKNRLPLIDWRKIDVDASARTVKLRKKGMALGTGGITKGYALDRASDILKRAGLRDFMIFGGGQIMVSGKKNGRGWRVGIQHPRQDDYFAFVEATSGSIATAGDYEHYFVKDGRRWHHIIDTKTGLPVTHTKAVTVVAESGLAADAVDTAIFVMGAKKSLSILDEAPFKSDAVIVDSELHMHVSPGMQQRLVMHAPLHDGKLPPGDWPL